MSDPMYKGLSSLEYATAGAFSGFVTRFTCQPLDVLKIIFQLQVDPKCSSKYTSIIQAITVIIKEEGASALWKGHVPAQWLSIAYGAIQYSAYEKIVQIGSEFGKRNGTTFNTSALHFYAGSVSGTTAITLSFPFDTIRTRLVAQHKSKVYKGLFDAGRQIWMKEGPKGYFRGLLPASLQIAPSSGLVFTFKHVYTQIWNHITVGIPESYQVSAKGHMITGLFAGISSKILMHPLDVIKKRLQIQGMGTNGLCLKSVPHYKSFISCLLLILKCEGFFGFYRGITPALIKSGAASGINFTVYNETCKLLTYINR